MPRELKQRFLDKAVRTKTCWFWRGAKTPSGYGKMKIDRRTVLAHRVSYEIYIGPIPDGLVIDHLCRVRHCVNPKHLEAKTNVENVMAEGSLSFARVQADRTECPRGHPLSEPNLRPWSLARGSRSCLACSRARAYRRDNPHLDFHELADKYYEEILRKNGL